MSLPAASYHPRHPQDTDYYHCIEDYFETFMQEYDDHFSRQYGFWLVRSRPPLKIHDPPNIEYATADLKIQPHTDIIYADPEYSWDDYIQS